MNGLTVMPSPSDKPNMLWRRLAIVGVIVAVALLLRWTETSQTLPTSGRLPSTNPPAPANDDDLPSIRPADAAIEKKVEVKKTAKEAVDVGEAQAASAIVKNVTLKNESGRIIYRGDVDLAPTLDRIAAGKLLDQFRNDGSVFQNRERRLPKRPSEYYREYVVPTEGQSGPGPQRLVVGKEGEAYYTHDHYKTFRKIR